VLDEPDQQAVVDGLRHGSRDAWSTLYGGYSVDVWRCVARLVGPDSAAVADIVQETFLVAARSARQFDHQRGTLWSWLAGIAHHQSALYWRQVGKAARLRELVEARAHQLRRWLESTESADEVWKQQEMCELVRAVLAEIPADYAALLTAKYLDDRSLDQLSQELGGSVEAVKSKLARARREFRAKFEMLTREPSPGSPPRSRDATVLQNPVSQTKRP
jgi:RNA polymerase sigma-70 factor (ECF subfamily)